MSIFLTALATLIVTVLAGVLLDYWRNTKPKILFKVRDALPIDIDGKKIGAYQIEIINTSKKTIEDISVHIEANVSNLKNGGVFCPQGFVYQINIEENKAKLDIPFFKEKEELSIIIIAENQYHLPAKPQVAIRSPHQFKLVNFNEIEQRKNISLFQSLTLPLVASATATTMALSITTFGFMPKSQKDVLSFAASTSELPELVKIYATSDSIKYFNQGDLAYALAKQSESIEEVFKYKKFLEIAIRLSPHMTNGSKGNNFYSLGKICLLLDDKISAKKHFTESIRLNKKNVIELIEYDDEARAFINDNALL